MLHHDSVHSPSMLYKCPYSVIGLHRAPISFIFATIAQKRKRKRRDYLCSFFKVSRCKPVIFSTFMTTEHNHVTQSCHMMSE